MARPLRIEYEGAVYHIISRGNRAEHIFSEDRDKEYFIETLQKAVEKYKIIIYAYCIMGNHYHLLMTVPYGELKIVMHYVGSTYGSYLRRYRNWIGHVFAGRYKSLCVEKESYLLELSRYIHLNPVRAGIVKLPGEYRWSSYAYYIGNSKNTEWINTEWILEEYGITLKKAQKKYREFIESALENPPPYPVKDIVGQAILGSKEFVKKAVAGISGKSDFQEITAKRIYSTKIDLDELYKAICDHYGIKGLGKGTEVTTVKGKMGREMFIFIAKEESSYMNREIAERIGNISLSAVTHQYKRTLRRLKADKKFSHLWEREKSDIISRFKG